MSESERELRQQIIYGQNEFDPEMAKRYFDKATEILFKMYQDKVFRICLTRIKNSALADDITQDCFVAAYIAMPQFRFKSSVLTWILGICFKKILKEIRDQRRHQRILVENQGKVQEELHPDLRDQQRNVEQLIELCRQYGVYERLSRKEQELFLQRYIAEMTLDEMVKQNPWMSKTKLQKRLTKIVSKLSEGFKDVR